MRFYEYEAKALFARHGLPLGRNGLARSAEDARRIAAELGGPVVLKSQVACQREPIIQRETDSTKA